MKKTLKDKNMQKSSLIGKNYTTSKLDKHLFSNFTNYCNYPTYELNKSQQAKVRFLPADNQGQKSKAFPLIASRQETNTQRKHTVLH